MAVSELAYLSADALVARGALGFGSLLIITVVGLIPLLIFRALFRAFRYRVRADVILYGSTFMLFNSIFHWVYGNAPTHFWLKQVIPPLDWLIYGFSLLSPAAWAHLLA